MDIPTAFFLFVGFGLLLVPLDTITGFLLGNTSEPHSASYYSLLVPGAGIVFLVIGLLSYHKKNLQYLFLRMCQDIEQTGYGRGLGNSLVEAFRPLLHSTNGSGSGSDLQAISSVTD